MCIRNDGTVMISSMYNLSLDGDLKTVFNFLLSMLITAVESLPNTSTTKPGPEQDEKIKKFHRDVLVEVFDMDDNTGTNN